MERFTTCIAPCAYPFLQQPKTDPNGEYESVFQINLVLDSKVKDQGELLQQISNLWKESKGTDEKKKPIKKHIDTEGNETGLYTIKFKTKADFADSIPTFDAQGSRIVRDKNFVANDSKVRVNWSFGYYKQGGGGVSLYLNGVQIIELIEWMGASAESMGFGPTEGYVEDTTPAEFSDEDKAKVEELKKEVSQDQFEAPSGPSPDEGKGDEQESDLPF